MRSQPSATSVLHSLEHHKAPQNDQQDRDTNAAHSSLLLPINTTLTFSVEGGVCLSFLWLPPSPSNFPPTQAALKQALACCPSHCGLLLSAGIQAIPAIPPSSLLLSFSLSLLASPVTAIASQGHGPFTQDPRRTPTPDLGSDCTQSPLSCRKKGQGFPLATVLFWVGNAYSTFLNKSKRIPAARFSKFFN